MAKLPKLLKAVAGAAGGAGLDVDEVFSTYLYAGTGSAQTITNGIDLAGEGGIVWLKDRGDTTPHTIHTTDIGALNYLVPHYIAGNNAGSAGYGLTAFNSDGFSLGIDYEGENGSGDEYVSWTFRKAPKFFDIQTWTGNGSNRTIAHNLDCEVGMMLVKLTSGADGWAVYHRGLDSSAPEDYRLRLDGNNARIDNTDGSRWNRTAPTSSVFSLGTDGSVNANGSTYVAYLFAHNNSDGGFGPSGDQDIIKCGTYTTNSSAKASINLGFEPQWIIYRPYDDTADWKIIDNIRGFRGSTPVSGNYNKAFSANRNFAEYDEDGIHLTPTGFEHVSGFASKNFIYTAIRRGPLAEPTSGTDVFAVDQENSSAPYYTSNFPVDMAIRTDSQGQGKFISSRITGTEDLRTDSTGAQDSSSGTEWDFMDGYRSSAEGNTWYGWMWKRARGYFDTVAYSGNGSTQNVSHNLGAVPEMIWIKSRNATEEWKVYHSAIGNNKELVLSSTAASGNTSAFNYTTPTSSVFSLGAASPVNDGAYNFIAYLFASVAGVSKVGSFSFSTGGSSTNVTCGFQPRFILLKKYNGTGNWHMFDTSRGITSGNDHRLELDTTDQNNNGFDWVDLTSDGFTFNDIMGEANSSYIFYAIA